MRAELQLEKLAKIRAAIINRTEFNKVLSISMENLIKKNFRTVSGTEKNKFGKGSSFWKGIIALTRGEHDEKAAYVDMPRPVAQRYFGGTIKPTGTRKFLTIPISKKSYGVSARSFGKLEVYTSEDEKRFLVLETEKKGKSKLEFLYILLSKVTQKPNKSILPSGEVILAGMKKTLKKYLRDSTR